MRPQTSKIKEGLKKLTSIKDKVKLLKNAYKGESCYVLTAGPSLNDMDKTKLKNYLSDKLVISVKQTIGLVSDIADFHIINEYNYQSYTISEGTIKIKLKTAKRLFTPGYRPDVEFSIDQEMIRSNTILAETKEFDKYKMENQLDRPLGSGIVYELGIYLPLLFGVNEINFVGWDIGSLKSDQVNRFYEKIGIVKRLENILIKKLPFTYNKVYNRLRNIINLIIFYIFRGNKSVINVPPIRESESKIISDSTKDLYNWLNSLGVKSFVVSNRSLCHDVIPRKNIV